MTKKEIEEKLEKLSNKSTEILNEIYELTVKLEKINIEESVNHGDFLEGTWELILNGDQLQLKGNTDTFVQLSRNLQNDYHTITTIDDNTKIHFSDEDIYIIADSEEKLNEFASKNHLRINMGSALKVLKRLDDFNENILQK